MKSRVSSTVTKRKPNPRPRKYASASERQAAYRDRAPEVCFRAEPRTVETLDRIADTIDRSRAELLLSMTKFALTNHDWERFGLTHKTLPKYEENPVKTEILDRAKLPNGTMVRLQKRGKAFDVIYNSTGITWWYLEKAVSEERARNAFDLYVMQRKDNPMKTPARKTTTKRTPTPAQLAARERFAEMARAGSFKKAGGRKSNPAASGPVKMKIRGSETLDNPEGLIVTEAGALRWAKQNMPKDLKRAGFVPSVVAGARGWSINYGAAVPGHSTYFAGVRGNPAPAKQRMGRIVRVDPKTGVPFGTELVPIDFAFKEYIGNYQQDFFARTEGAQLVVSEKTTGAKVGAVPFTLRSAALNDRAAAKAFVQKTVEKVGADRFNDAIRKAPKLTA